MRFLHMVLVYVLLSLFAGEAFGSASPEVIFLAGTPGSGKGHILRHFEDNGDINLQSFTIIDFDYLKKMIPDLNASFMNDELAAKIVEVIIPLLKNNSNLIIDSSLFFGTNQKKLLERFKREFPNYRRKLIFVRTSIATALDRFGRESRLPLSKDLTHRVEKEYTATQTNFFSFQSYFHELILVKNEDKPEIVSYQTDDKIYLSGLQSISSIRDLVAKSPPIAKTFNIVFDLDWTLIYNTRENSEGTADVVLSEKESYKFADGAGEIIEALLGIPGVKVSFFSGGPASRNEEVLKKLILPSGRSAFEIAYQIRSFADLERRPGVPDSVHFTKRYRKNPDSIDHNSENTIIVEDSPQFIDLLQQANVLWIGAPYEYIDREEQVFDPEFRDGKIYIPNSIEDFKRERQKLIWAYGAFVAMFDLIKNGLATSLTDANTKLLGQTALDNKANPAAAGMERFLTLGHQHLAQLFPGFKALQSHTKKPFSRCIKSLNLSFEQTL